VLEDEVLGPKLWEPRMFDQRVVGRGERADKEIELEPEATARRRSLGGPLRQ
jgi:hypothetical protein